VDIKDPLDGIVSGVASMTDIHCLIQGGYAARLVWCFGAGIEALTK
jgi:hypothetical protein